MKLTSLVSAAVALLMTGGMLPCAEQLGGFASESDYSATAADNIVYMRKADHVELSDGSSVRGSFTVPDSVWGLPVTVIDTGAFTGSELTDIVIPEAVTAIGDSAFMLCPSLTSVTVLNPDCKIFSSSHTFSNRQKDGGTKGIYTGTITGYDNSTAKAHAELYNISFRSLGAAPDTVSSTTTSKATTTTTSKKTTTTTTTTSTTSTTTTTVKPAVQGKPEFRISSTEVYRYQARGKSLQLNLSVDGADGLYCDTLIYVYYDKRLKAGEAVSGSAIEKLTPEQAFGDTGDFLVLTTAGSENAGRDGVMWELNFTLPEDARAGDVYEISIGPSKYGEIQPLFTNFDYDDKGTAMTEYIFSKGLAKGSFIIKEDPPYIAGDVNNDKAVNAVDASRTLMEYAFVSSGHEPTFTEEWQILAADVNRDDKIDAVDASLILSYYAHISSTSDKQSMEEFIAGMKDKK